MKISISNDRKLSDVQADFHAMFPYLKIEFFKAPHKIGESSSKILIYNSSRYVRDCRAQSNEGDLTLNEKMSVNDLEEQFRTVFGLSVQVFRKSVNVWLETSATDAWTLREQNDEGAELSKQIRQDREDLDNTDVY